MTFPSSSKSVGRKRREIQPTLVTLPSRCDLLVPWRERPAQQMKVAADIAGVSVATLYGSANQGKLKLLRLGGRTLVETNSLIDFLRTAEVWKPSRRGEAARAKRANAARATWRV